MGVSVVILAAAARQRILDGFKMSLPRRSFSSL